MNKFKLLDTLCTSVSTINPNDFNYSEYISNIQKFYPMALGESDLHKFILAHQHCNRIGFTNRKAVMARTKLFRKMLLHFKIANIGTPLHNSVKYWGYNHNTHLTQKHAFVYGVRDSIVQISRVYDWPLTIQNRHQNTLNFGPVEFTILFDPIINNSFTIKCRLNQVGYRLQVIDFLNNILTALKSNTNLVCQLKDHTIFVDIVTENTNDYIDRVSNLTMPKSNYTPAVLNLIKLKNDLENKLTGLNTELSTVTSELDNVKLKLQALEKAAQGK